MTEKADTDTRLDLHSTTQSVPMALIRAREKVMGPIRKMLAESGLTEQQWRILRVLEEFGKTEPTRLAEQTCLLLPSLSRILQTLVDKGYVTRVAMVITKRTAPDMPTEVESLLDTPRNGQIPRNWESTILFTKTAAIMIKIYSSIF